MSTELLINLKFYNIKRKSIAYSAFLGYNIFVKGDDFMKIAKSFSELVGKTPLLELCRIEESENLSAHIFAKLEFMNPGGSIKDRAALSMIDEAEKSGVLKPGALIIEPTSGNTGIGLAAVAAERGYRCIIVMPDSMSTERRAVLKALGAELVLVEGALGMTGCIEKAKEIMAENPGAFMPSQFENPANPMAHILSTAPEILEQTDGKTDIFVAGIGTGGTISGCGKFLKEHIENVKIVGVEPASSRVLSGETPPGKHKIQGIGPNYIPKNVDFSVIDEIVPIADEEAFEHGRMLAKREGILCGISSGAALAAAVKLAKLPENSGKNIVVILPDTGNRYLSGDYYT